MTIESAKRRVFDPDDIDVMSSALSCALGSLRIAAESEQSYVVAKMVIRMLANGERDPSVICRSVVGQLGRLV